MRHLPRVAPSKIQCTNPNASQAAARHANHGHHNCRVTSPLTALPASENNETPTTCSAVQHAPNNQVQRRQACEMIRDVDEVFKTYCASTMSHKAEARQKTVDTVINSRQSGSASRTGAGHHVRHPVYISGLRPRGRQRTTGTKSHTPKEGNTLHSGRSKAQRETPDHHGSHFPGSGTNVGHYKQLIPPNARDPPRTRLNTTTSQFSLPSTGDPCIIHKKWTRRVRMQTQ